MVDCYNLFTSKASPHDVIICGASQRIQCLNNKVDFQSIQMKSLKNESLLKSKGQIIIIIIYARYFNVTGNKEE